VPYVDKAVVEEEAEYCRRHPPAADPVGHHGRHDALRVGACHCVVPGGERIGAVGGVREIDEEEQSQYCDPR
jgi:hypothetical protein